MKKKKFYAKLFYKKSSTHLQSIVSLTTFWGVCCLLFSYSNLIGQNCSVANITLATQAEIDNFQTTFGFCTTVTGNLRIQDDNNGVDNITNLAGLSNVNSIGGGLIIENSHALANIDGLSSVNSIGGELTIENNNTLANIDDLSSLNSIGGEFIMENNDILANTDGLSSLNTIGGELSIRLNSTLANIDGLSNLNSIGGGLIIETNNILGNIDGLLSLNNVTGNLSVRFNFSIANIDGLSNLNNVTGDLYIVSNNNLGNIDGLSNIITVMGDLIVSANNNLANIDGLSSVNNVGGSLAISSGNNLTNINGLLNISNIGGNLSVQHNNNLVNIDGLSNVNNVGGDLYVQNNNQLSECCGLFPVLMGGGAGVTGTITMSGNLAAGNCNNNGADADEIAECSAFGTAITVPSLGEWGLIILALLLLSIGILFSLQPNIQLSGTANYSIKSNYWGQWQIPFNKRTFSKIWICTIVILIILFTFSIYFFGYELTNADMPMSILASSAFAFLGQLLALKEKL